MLPAYAGMIPPSATRMTGGAGAPRVCGDDPSIRGLLLPRDRVLPAYAGMIHVRNVRVIEAASAPRVCGDDPEPIPVSQNYRMCSPRMRG